MNPAADETGGGQKSPEELRQDIKETREGLGDTVEALAEKTDVKAQATDRIAGAKESAQQKKEELAGKVKSATPASAATGAQQVAGKAKQNPMPLAIGGAFLAGLVVGRATSRR